ncbi:MAG TPA: hypothetical protein VK674_06095 [Candidatus Limnocylindria bacterium]|nr:hypothetical protein [Candidatus Limnocylindria bacterium]
MLKTFLQKVAGGLTISALAVSSLAVARAPQVLAAAQDCGPNAIIYCGVTDLNNLKAKYRENQAGNVDDVYRHFGIANEAAMDGVVKGRVTKSGDVFVGTQKVATGAQSAGRKNLPGSTKLPGIEAYKRPTNVSFRSESLEAFVQMRGGSFKFAVLLACGNPVTAKPVVKPKPTPTPTPQPEPKQPGLEIKKDVRVAGDTDWQQEVEADPGAEVEYRITVENTGETDLENLEIQDSLPEGVSFDDVDLEGSDEAGQFQVSDLVGGGIELGSLAKGDEIEIQFTVTVGTEVDACEEPLQNVAFAQADDVPEEEDDALVKVCQPEEPEEEETPEVLGVQTPPSGKMPETGAAVAGVFSVTSILGFAAYKLKEFYSLFLR